jgi:hypothetical protein
VSLQDGVDWLVSQQGDDGAWVGFTGESDPGVTIDAVLALTAAANAGIEVDLTSASQYLNENGREYVKSGVGQAAKMVQVAVALGENPEEFAKINAVRWMLGESDESTTRYGAGTYDTALVILALDAIGEAPPSTAVRWMKRQQLDDGSWSFDGTRVAGNGDTNTTAIVIQALFAIEQSRGQSIPRALQYLRDTQLEQGFPFQFGPDAVQDANSTALVVQALIAAGEDPSSPEWQNVYGAMLAFQTADGSFSYQLEPLEANLFATVQVLPALASQPFPILADTPPDAADVMPTCTAAQLEATPPADADLPCAA